MTHSPEVKFVEKSPHGDDPWRQIRWRRNFFFLSFFGYFFIPVLLLETIGLSGLFQFFVWLALAIWFLFSVIRLYRSFCPRCGKRFFYKRYFPKLWQPFHQCAH